jgi:serine/threonine-protein kinase
VAEALEFVNGLGIVHRDIKPENVHIDRTGRVRLMDFGIAKTADLSLTKTGMAMGTPYYMAPEQVSGKPGAASMDVYAFGMLFYELLTGVRAVNGEAIEAVLYQILNVPLDPAPMVNAGVPAGVRELVLHCVEKKAEDRPRNFGVIVAELRGLISSASEKTQPVAVKTVPFPVPPPVVAPRRRSSAIWAVPVALLIVIGAGAAWWIARPKAPPAPPVILGMIYIPAGSFLVSALNHPMEMHAFYIDETEVSNADFATFCVATGCPPPEGAPDLPVVRVTIAQAREFAKWKGKRLPNLFEWERAARGTNGQKYPWGDADDPSLANVDGHGLMPVRSFNAYPEYQMAGNAWEMVEASTAIPSPQTVERFKTLLTPPPTAEEKWVVIRGGSFNMPLKFAVSYESSFIPERYSSSDIGFRCAKSVP